MIYSVTIFNKGGTVLYHNQSTNSPLSSWKENHLDLVNRFISTILLEGKHKYEVGPCREVLLLEDQRNVVVEWLDGSKSSTYDENACLDWIALAFYPDVALRKLQGVDALLSSIMKRYSLFYDHHCQQYKTAYDQHEHDVGCSYLQLYIPPKNEFDAAYYSILRRFQDQIPSSTSNATTDKRQSQKSKSSEGFSSSNAKKKGKENTVWHDGKGKVTKAALAELDMSKGAQDPTMSVLAPGEIRKDSRAIEEARATYLPSQGEKPAWEEEDEADFDIQWSSGSQNDDPEEGEGKQSVSGLRGFFSKLLAPNRPLTKSDLDPPLKEMQQLLTSKNVALSTAQAICEVVERQLLGKKVGTLMGVKRAVRHALEDAVEKILRPELGAIGSATRGNRGKSVDVLRGVIERRERGKGGGILGLGGSSKSKHPFVIVMIGINGEFLLFLLSSYLDNVALRLLLTNPVPMYVIEVLGNQRR
eukprot:CCRYP_005377-RA/>CCRYP_005377-RA protein AED:0.02 eAED:0.02 QI:117/1/1/1/1/1/2/629/472